MQQSAAPVSPVSRIRSAAAAVVQISNAADLADRPVRRWLMCSGRRAASARLTGFLLMAGVILQAPHCVIGQTDATKSATGQPAAGRESSTPGGGFFAATDDPSLKTLSVPLDNKIDDVDAPLLNVPTTVSLIDVPLVDAIQHVSQLNDVAILLDAKALDDQGIAQDEPVNLHLDAPLPLHRLLDVLLHPLELTWYMQDGIIHVTTLEAHDERLMRRMYDVQTLRLRGINADTLLDVVMAHSHSEWMTYDGYGGEVLLVGNTLVVSASYQTQRRVRAVLQSLVAPDDGSPVENALEYAEVELALDCSLTVNFADFPLQDIANHLANEAGHPVVINSRALDEIGVAVDEPVNLVLSDVSLRTIFEIVLSPLDCTVVTKAGMIEITSNEVAAETTLTAVYDLRSAPLTARQQVVAMLPKATGGQWVDYDGDGGELTLTEDGLVVVTHTEPVQAEIRRLLAGWRLTDRRLRVDGNVRAGSQVERRVYQLDLSTAEDLLVQLPALVLPDTWQSKDRPDGGRVALIRIGSEPAPVSPSSKADDDDDEKKKSDSEKSADKKQAAHDGRGFDQPVAEAAQALASNRLTRTKASVASATKVGITNNPGPTVLSQFGGGVSAGPGFGSGGFGASTACYGMYQSRPTRQGHFPHYSAALVVDQTPAVHEAIDRFLADLGIATQGFKPVDQEAADSYDQVSP